MLIRFTKRGFAETEGRNRGVTYEVGTELDLPFPSALRWIRRGVAVEIPASKPRLQLDRPMAVESAASSEEPKEKPKRRSPKKYRQLTASEAGFRTKNMGPSLPVKGSGKNGGPGWDA